MIAYETGKKLPAVECSCLLIADLKKNCVHGEKCGKAAILGAYLRGCSSGSDSYRMR